MLEHDGEITFSYHSLFSLGGGGLVLNVTFFVTFCTFFITQRLVLLSTECQKVTLVSYWKPVKACLPRNSCERIVTSQYRMLVPAEIFNPLDWISCCGWISSSLTFLPIFRWCSGICLYACRSLDLFGWSCQSGSKCIISMVGCAFSCNIRLAFSTLFLTNICPTNTQFRFCLILKLLHI